MAPIVSYIDIACQPAKVFGYVTDPSRFANCQDDVLGLGPPRNGGIGRDVPIRSHRLSLLAQTRLHDSTHTLRPDPDDRLPDVTCVLDNITSEEARLPIPYGIEHVAGINYRLTAGQVGLNG